MGVFVKVAGVGVIVCVGSLLMLGLALSGHVALAWLVLVATGAATLATIVRLAHGGGRAPR